MQTWESDLNIVKYVMQATFLALPISVVAIRVLRCIIYLVTKKYPAFTQFRKTFSPTHLLSLINFHLLTFFI